MFTSCRVSAKPRTDRQSDADFALMQRCIKVTLSRDTSAQLPATYEQLYTTCQSVVCVAGRAKALSETLRLELEKCVSRLQAELYNQELDDSKWLELIVTTFGWFEKQIVCVSATLLAMISSSHPTKNLLQSILTYFNTAHMHHRKDFGSI